MKSAVRAPAPSVPATATAMRVAMMAAPPAPFVARSAIAEHRGEASSEVKSVCCPSPHPNPLPAGLMRSEPCAETPDMTRVSHFRDYAVHDQSGHTGRPAISTSPWRHVDLDRGGGGARGAEHEEGQQAEEHRLPDPPIGD